MPNVNLTAEQISTYDRDGYLIVKTFLSTEEVDRLQAIAFEDGVMRKHAFDLNDQTGKRTV